MSRRVGFLTFERVYGHPCSFSTPLDIFTKETPLDTVSKEVDLRDSLSGDKLVRSYCHWMGSSRFSSQLCFLDITFGPVGAERNAHDVTTLILAPDEERVETYKKALDRYLEGGSSLAAHYVFQGGLPIFVSEETGEIVTPNTAAALRRIER
jgi:hypothetical protein